MTTEFIAELFDIPDAQLIINRVQAMLDDEKNRRQEFQEWLQDDIKAEFINGEVIMHSPVKRRYLRANGNLTTLLRIYVQANDLGRLIQKKRSFHSLAMTMNLTSVSGGRRSPIPSMTKLCSTQPRI